MSLNIGGSADDLFYRYKMPKVITTLQKKHGGTTIVINTKEISESIRRNPIDIKKYISKSLKRPVQIKNDCWIMPGEVKTAEIQEIIKKYVVDYVLCGVCGNPETDMNKNKLLCKSCGKETLI